MYACVFCQTHYCANDCQFLDTESEYTPMTTMTRSIAETLAHALLSSRTGYTIRRDGTVPTTGVAVADHDRTATYPLGVGCHELDYIARYILANDSEYYGIWEEEGMVYLDCIILYPSTPDGIRDAIEFGRLTGELAVFDLATGLEYQCRVEDAITPEHPTN